MCPICLSQFNGGVTRFYVIHLPTHMIIRVCVWCFCDVKAVAPNRAITKREMRYSK